MPIEHPAGEKIASTRPLEQVLQDANEGLDPKKKQGGERAIQEDSTVWKEALRWKGVLLRGHYGQTVTKQGTVARQPGIEDLTGFIRGWEFLGKMQ